MQSTLYDRDQCYQFLRQPRAYNITSVGQIYLTIWNLWSFVNTKQQFHGYISDVQIDYCFVISKQHNCVVVQ